MDDFETISLEKKECKICKQETGEELISCILREKFSSADNASPTGQCKRKTADCGLRTTDCGPGIKGRLWVKCRLQTKSKTQAGVKCRLSINCSHGRV